MLWKRRTTNHAKEGDSIKTNVAISFQQLFVCCAVPTISLVDCVTFARGLLRTNGCACIHLLSRRERSLLSTSVFHLISNTQLPFTTLKSSSTLKARPTERHDPTMSEVISTKRFNMKHSVVYSSRVCIHGCPPVWYLRRNCSAYF